MIPVKICGLFRADDICAVNAAMPDYAGFVINFPKSHRSISPAQASLLRQKLSSKITPVGVFVDQPVELVASLIQSGAISIAQLHGSEDAHYIAALRARTSAPIWKAYRAAGPADMDRANQSTADMVLVDSGTGSGVAFSWTLLRRLKRPFILAGGLNEENIVRAMYTGAACLDLSSAVETGRLKDPVKIKRIVAMIKGECIPCPKDDLAPTAGNIFPKR